LETDGWQLGAQIEQVKTWQQPNKAMYGSQQGDHPAVDERELTCVLQIVGSLIEELPSLHKYVLVDARIEYVHI
jgi:hypothetical protein